MRPRAAGLLLLAVVAAGCQSPKQQVEESRKNLRSWAATLRLAAEQAGRLSAAFRKDLSRSASREVSKEARRLQKLAEKGAGGEATALVASAERLAAAAPALAGAGAASDGAAEPFAAIERDLEVPPP
jgi:hypothetical protein